ncbi:MAG: BMP family ABC transporter substrate-binding protein, partial [Oscillospiraceae bacterium]|nr:BMP family ABC transporter substrate-binding protein [Oscillospiraceae bacterium]
MKKRFLSVIALMLMLVLCLTACGGNGGETEGEAGGDDTISVCYVSTSNRGDDVFVDMIWGALEKAHADHGVEVSIVEMDNDASIYESTMMDVCDSGEYDLIVTGFFQMVDPTLAAAEQYPDQKFLVFDTGIDYSSGKYNNCVSAETKQNEGSFLAGALAAMLTNSGMEGMNEDKVVGFIGASAGTTIDDFLTGYIDGVHYIDPEIEVLYSYSGTFFDTAITREIALAQIEQKADVIYSVEDIAGIGVADAAYETGVGYTIDCNSDLAMKIKDNN